jgi:glycerol kinase
MLGVPVVVPTITDTTALGAAYLAGIASEQWTEEGVRGMWSEGARYEPRMSEDERHSLLAQWRRALQRAGRWVVEPD